MVPSTRFERRDDFEWYLNASQLAASTKCGAVVITPSCWDEIPPSSQFDQFTLDLRRIFRVPRLKTSQPGWHQLSEHRFEVIDAERVRQNRYTTGCEDDFDRLTRRWIAARDIRRTIAAQVSVERLVNGRDIAMGEKQPCSVRPGDRPALSNRFQILEREREAEPTELLYDARGALSPRLDQPLEMSTEHWLLRIDEVSQHVDFTSLDCGTQLDSRDNRDTELSSNRLCWRKTSNGVVISDAKHAKTARCRQLDELLR